MTDKEMQALWDANAHVPLGVPIAQKLILILGYRTYTRVGRDEWVVCDEGVTPLWRVFTTRVAGQLRERLRGSDGS